MSNITEKDIETLAENIRQKERQAEFNKLTQKLDRMSEPSEFDSAMAYRDNDNVLQSKGKKGFINLVIDRLAHMLSPRPVTGNFISLGLMIAVLITVRANLITQVGDYDIKAYLPYIGYLALFGGGLQVIKSSSRSLILPVIAIVVGGCIATTMSPDALVFTFTQSVYQGLFIVGLIGLVMGAISID
jgi:hypothetical protein